MKSGVFARVLIHLHIQRNKNKTKGKNKVYVEKVNLIEIVETVELLNIALTCRSKD